MKLLFILLIIITVSCKPEQEATTFNITVAPVAGENVQSNTLEEQPVLVEYSINENEDSIDLTFDLIEKPKHGELSDCKYLNKLKWQCLYIPHKDFNGTDTLAFKTRDGDFKSSEKAYLTITVQPVADAPEIGSDQEFTLVENTDLTFEVMPAKDVDTKSSDLQYVLVNNPEFGSVENCIQGVGIKKCKYIPNREYYGKDKLTYKVKDTDNLETKSHATVYFNILKEKIPVAGDSIIKIEDKKSNALIVFALDISNSMDPYLDHMKKSVANFVDDIAARGFKATLAFLDSDDQTTTLTKELDHPTIPKETGAKLELIQRIPAPSRVKIFEIDAYDFDWNNDTKVSIENIKKQINTFIDSLPDGKDDERLLCSAVRFLHSDHAKGKDYVGLFTIANEDDAVVAVNVKNAHSQCIKEQQKEYVPKASCSKTVACNYGEVGCNGLFTYYYKEPYTEVIDSYNSGSCEYQKTVYKSAQRTRAKGYEVKPKYVYQDVKECKEEWKNADNLTGCRMVRKQVQDGTMNQNVDRIGTCSQYPNIQNCTEYVQTYSVPDGTVTALKSCTVRGGNCDDHPQIQNCVHTPKVTNQKTRNKTKKTALDLTCLQATGYDTCYQNRVWAGNKTYTTSEGCGLEQKPVVTKNFDVPNILAADQSLSKSIHHKLTTGFSKSVFVGVINDEVLNSQALTKAEDTNLTLPSSDCLDYASNRLLYPGMDGQQFKAVADLLKDQGDFYSICSPERYPSGKLDFLVEDSQLDFLIPEYETTDDMKINAVEVTYANGTKKNLEYPKDYSYNDGHIVLNDSLLAKYLIEIKVSFEGYKK